MARVAWLFEYPTLNGGEHSLLATLAHVREAGFDVVAVAPPAGPLPTVLRGFEVPVVPVIAYLDSGKRKSQDQLRQELAAALGVAQPDLLHANSLAMGRLAGPVTRRLDLPSIAHLRDIVGLSGAAVRDLSCHDRLLAVSRATRDYHVAQGLSGEKTFVAYNGVDVDRFHPRTPSGWLHRELGINPQIPLIGAIGQLILRKGQDVLLEAAARLASRHEEFHLVILGERYSQKPEAADYEFRLREAANSPPLIGRVHFLGLRHDVERILPELAMLMHAARQEPLGRVLLEAAASGLPIVATDVGGTREIFPKDHGSARLVAPDDPQALADSAAGLLARAALRAELGHAARRRVEDSFTARRASDELCGHYRAVLAHLFTEIRIR